MRDESPADVPWHNLPGWLRGLAATQPGAVLLETARGDEDNFRSLLFLNPISELKATSPEQVDKVFREVDALVSRGCYAAGFVTYECGYALNAIPHDYSAGELLVRLSAFREPVVFDHRTGIATGADTNTATDYPIGQGEASVMEQGLDISVADYTERIGEIQDYLERGHSYQVNFTDRVTGRFRGTPWDFYRLLLQRQPVSYAAYIDCGDSQILSLSPELFYRAVNGKVTVRPMKGTWPRGINAEDDAVAAEALAHDPKNRAEHITIVDLLRNDLGKTCALGSVMVERLMQVERYPTLHQMTSTISGASAVGTSSSSVFRALFPSGSVTGAPKRRTMEIIREVERRARGVYTGAIGFFGPGGEACFNVAIRTLVTKGDRFELGVGGGITLDSDPADEFRECELKASFLHEPRHEFRLIETMRAIAGTIPLLDRHMHRLAGSAAYFQIAFDEQVVRSLLDGIPARYGNVEMRVRLTLDQQGCPAVECSPLEDVPWSGRVLLSPQRTDADDNFLRHKTTNRQLYEDEFARARGLGFDEVMFVNRDGHLTEGAVSNVFVQLRGEWVTPAVECGVLPGVQRAVLLEDGARSTRLTLADLQEADRIGFCNSVRGMREVTVVFDDQGQVVWQLAV